MSAVLTRKNPSSFAAFMRKAAPERLHAASLPLAPRLRFVRLVISDGPVIAHRAGVSVLFPLLLSHGKK